MKVTYKIDYSTSKQKKEKHTEIESIAAIKLFNEFHWEQIIIQTIMLIIGGFIGYAIAIMSK